MKKKYRLNKKNLILFILLLVFLTIMVYSSYNIVVYILDNNANREIKEKTEESITIIDDNDDNKTEISDPDDKVEKIKVDFATLKSQNPDTVAYLKVNGTNVSYVVVKGNNNAHYLYYNFNNNRNVSGWIFADYHNKLDGNDKNLVIYGHNVEDGSMFGSLKNILTSEWQNNKDNLQVTLVTEHGTEIYQVFSTYEIEVEDYYINTEFNSDEEFNEFVTKLYNRSNHDYGIPVSKDDHIITLSTCKDMGYKRVVLHAKRN
jgi:sortase B